MKQIYIVTGRDYYERPIMAYETRNDAVRAACAVHECDASESATISAPCPSWPTCRRPSISPTCRRSST